MSLLTFFFCKLLLLFFFREEEGVSEFLNLHKSAIKHREIASYIHEKKFKYTN